MQKRQKHILDINKSSQYKRIKVMDKNETEYDVAPQKHQNMFKTNKHYNDVFSQKRELNTPKGSIQSSSVQYGQNAMRSNEDQEAYQTQKTVTTMR